MNTRTMLKKIRLSQSSLENISGAVKKAEANTTGEIALALTCESANYAFWELLASVIAGGFVFFLLTVFSARLDAFLNKALWDAAAWHLPLFIGIISFGFMALAFFLVNVPAIDRIIVPAKARKTAVSARAERYFMQSGVCNTLDRSGILVFMSYLERQVRIIADTGISAKIPNDQWNAIAAELAKGIGTEKTEAAFIHAVERCGALLEQHFPAKKDNPNELENHLVILERAEW